MPRGAPLITPPHFIALPPCKPEELIGLAVEHDGKRIGTVIDMALIDERHARYFLVRRAADGRFVRVPPREVAAIGSDAVELAADL